MLMKRGHEMSKIVMTGAILALVLNFCFCSNYIYAYAQDDSGVEAADESDSVDKNTPLTKLSRGFCNAATFILEVPAQMGKVNEESGPLAAGSLGLFKGIGMACIRALVGIYEIATFPIPCPSGYKPVLNDPEYFYSDRTW